MKSYEIPHGCGNIFLSRLLSESTRASIYLFICNGKLPWWKHSHQLYLNTCYIGALCPPHLQAHVGCWVNTRLCWASLISFPHTASSLHSSRPLMAWEVALAIPKRRSWASCPCLQHIHHVAGASWEGGDGVALGMTNMPLGLHWLCSQSHVRGRLINSTQQGELVSCPSILPLLWGCLCKQGASAFAAIYCLHAHFPLLHADFPLLGYSCSACHGDKLP